MAIEPVTLTGEHVELAPLSQTHHEGLVDAVRDGNLHTSWLTTVAPPETMSAEIERRLDLAHKGTMVPFTVIARPSGNIVGMTTYMNIDTSAPRLEIGATWYAKSVQRTPLNTEVKLLLLTHAFEVLGCIAVELRTHIMNRQSRQAIERLGARLDGILRNHMVMANGTYRDTAVYSIIAPEWPAVRANLLGKLGREG